MDAGAVNTCGPGQFFISLLLLFVIFNIRNLNLEKLSDYVTAIQQISGRVWPGIQAPCHNYSILNTH